MRGSIWTSDVVLGLTILISTICSSCMVICLENEAGPQQQDDVNLMTSSSGGSGAPNLHSNSHDPAAALFLPQPALTDRYFRNYYEMLRDTEPVWKRAPAAGFVGMRGKKVPSSTFYGMRGKKGPSGFLGMRGKKSHDPALLGVAVGGPSSVLDLTGGTLRMKGPASSSPLLSSAALSSTGAGSMLDTFDDYSLFGASGPSAGLIPTYKRAPAEGFMGLRGKRSTLTLGQPSRSYI